MDRLIPVLAAVVVAVVIVAFAVQVGYCVFLGDPTSPRYWAICQADD